MKRRRRHFSPGIQILAKKNIGQAHRAHIGFFVTGRIRGRHELAVYRGE